MYEINNIPLSDFGIIPGQIKGSNLALSGWLDMPKRLGKTYHEWSEQQGVEPYVDWEDIYFEGRDLQFKGFVKYDSIEQLEDLLNRFYVFLKGEKNLLKLDTPYGIFEVFIRKEIKTELIQHKLCDIEIVFREPKKVVPYMFFESGFFSPDYFAEGVNTVIFNYDSNYSVFGIDGIPFYEIGAFMKKPEKQMNRASVKREYKLSSFRSEAYQITEPGDLKTKVNLIFKANSIEQLKRNVQALQVLLSKPNVRTLQIDNRLIQGFCVAGYKVKNIRNVNNYCTCEINIELIQITERYFKPGFFVDGIFQ